MSNYDRINFVLFGSGTVVMDFTNQRCRHNNLAISPLRYCIDYYDWLAEKCTQHNLDIAAVTTAELTAKMDVSIQREQRGIPGWLTTTMNIECSSRLVFYTTEYTSQMQDRQESGLGQIIHDHSY